jgi:hypothetical protein
VKYAAFLVTALSSGAFSCHKQNTVPIPPVRGSLQVLTEQGQPATVVTQGQNIIFRFQLSNNSDHEIFLPNPLFDPATFLTVSNRAGVLFGKPYTNIFCTFQGGTPLAAGKTITLSIPWVEAVAYPMTAHFCRHATTSYLPVGQYQTHFATAFTWNESNSSTTFSISQTSAVQEFNCEFEVK